MSSLYRSLVSNCAAALKEAILFHWRGLKLNVEESWSSARQTWNVSTAVQRYLFCFCSSVQDLAGHPYNFFTLVMAACFSSQTSCAVLGIDRVPKCYVTIRRYLLDKFKVQPLPKCWKLYSAINLLWRNSKPTTGLTQEPTEAINRDAIKQLGKKPPILMGIFSYGWESFHTDENLLIRMRIFSYGLESFYMDENLLIWMKNLHIDEKIIF